MAQHQVKIALLADGTYYTSGKRLVIFPASATMVGTEISYPNGRVVHPDVQHLVTYNANKLTEQGLTTHHANGHPKVKPGAGGSVDIED